MPDGHDQRNYAASWQDWQLSLGPNVLWSDAGSRYAVWSPVLRRNLLLRPAEADFLRGFRTSRRVYRILPDLIRLEKEASRGTEPTLSAYLRIQNYLAHGLLVHDLLLQKPQIANLHFAGHTRETLRILEERMAARAAIRIRDLTSPNISSVLDEHRLGQLLKWYGNLRTRDANVPHAPLQICRRPDGELALLRDAERAVAALRYGFPLRAQVLQPAEFFGNLVDMPHEFFGTMRGDMPYQSIYFERQELVSGAASGLTRKNGQGSAR